MAAEKNILKPRDALKYKGEHWFVICEPWTLILKQETLGVDNS